MKKILVILDGVADRPCKELRGVTPLEAAYTPNLDHMARQGKLGYMYPIKKGFVPESDNAITSLLGYSPFLAARGAFEALGAGVKFESGDLVLRANFATITNMEEKKVEDRRAGRTLIAKEAAILAKTINKRVKLPYKFIFKPTVDHRGVLIIKGGFSDNITNTDPSYRKKGTFEIYDKLQYSRPLDDDETSKLSSNIVNSFVEQSFSLLQSHPINKRRKQLGLLPANIIITRDASIELPALKKPEGRWAALAYMPLEIGIAKLLKMDVFSFPCAPKTPDVYSNLFLRLQKAINIAKKIIKLKYDHFYIHFKETDVPGHDGLPTQKKKMIELIDDFFSVLRKEKAIAAITADHSTPCSLKAHSADPVPLLLYGKEKDKSKRFTEKEAKKGSIGKIYGKDVLNLLKE